MLGSKILYQINNKQFQLTDPADEYKPVWVRKHRMKGVLSFVETEAGIAVADSSGKLISLDKTDGKIKWELSLNNPLSQPPAVDDEGLFIFAVDNKRNFYKISVSSGEILLKVRLDNNITSPPLYFKERVYFATENGLFIAFDADDLESDWEFNAVNSTVAKAIGYDHMVCFATLGNHVYCRNRRSGSLELRARADKRLYISPLITDDYLLAFPFSGSIVAVNINNPKIKGKFTYEKRIIAPVFAMPKLRLLLVMTKEGALEALSYSAVFAMQPPRIKKKPRRQRR
jgi:outer membrane protein assembly factor BamB